MKKEHAKVLKKITDNIPKDLLDKLMVEEDTYEPIRRVLEASQTDPNFPEEKRAYSRAVLESGLVHQKEETVNEEVEREIERYFETEIQAARDRGELPKKARLPKLTKLKRHVREKQKFKRRGKRYTSSEGGIESPYRHNEESNH